MTYLLRNFFVFIAFILMCGCGSRTVAVLQQVQTADQAIAAFGPPNQSVTLGDGNTVLLWASRRQISTTVYRPASYNVYGNMGQYAGSIQGGSFQNEYHEGICQMKIIVSSTGQILSKDLVGNDCN